MTIRGSDKAQLEPQEDMTEGQHEGQRGREEGIQVIYSRKGALAHGPRNQSQLLGAMGKPGMGSRTG